MVTLAIDTSHPAGSVTLRVDDGTSETVEFGSDSSHLVELGEAVLALSDRRGVDVVDLDCVAVVSGPGSFTGLRIGMAYAKGLHAALGVDLVTMTSLELLAVESLVDAELVCPMIDARRSEVYTALYARGEAYRSQERLFKPRCELPPQATTPDAFLPSLGRRPVVFVGSGARHWREMIAETLGGDARFAEKPTRPSTEILSRLADCLPPVRASGVAEMEPFYIRPSDAKLKPLKKVRTHE